MELCIDSSTRYASVGVAHDNDVIAEVSWRSDRNHSAELVPRIRYIMKKADLSIKDMDAVFVAQGPGGFSALRVGISFAKSLAMARQIKLIGVDTLQIEAKPHIAFTGLVCAVIGAGRGRVYASHYTRGTLLQQAEVLTHEELAQKLPESTLVCGEEACELSIVWDSLGGKAVTFWDTEKPTRTVKSLSQLGYERLAQGDTDDLMVLQPTLIGSTQFTKAEQNRKRRTNA